MTDKDKIEVLYRYILLVNPKRRVCLKSGFIFLDDGPGLGFTKIYCKNNTFAAFGYDCDFECVQGVFMIHKVPYSKVQGIVPSCVKYHPSDSIYILVPKNVGLFK